MLPPIPIITDKRDVQRDQGEEFGRHLQPAGIDTTLTRHDRIMHEFFAAAAVLDKAEQAQHQAAEHSRRGFDAAITLVP